ncbi:MAG: hypothetical protein AB7I19_10945 [Planctomycetota bacterium]
MTRPFFSLLALLAITACGGGGGGGSAANPAPPTLVGATLLQAGPTPVPGDRLLLSLSEVVELAPNAVLDDGDFAITNGSLGTVTTPPTLIDARTIQIVLGNGMVIADASTTIAFAATNDAVTDLSGAPADGGAPIAVRRGDGRPPSVQSVTIEEIDTALNGGGTAGGTLQVPRTGFSIDVLWFDLGGTMDSSRSLIVADGPVSVAGTLRPAGTGLQDALTITPDGTTTHFRVPSDVLFPVGPVSVTMYAVDATGMPATPRSFGFRTVSANDTLRPFERDQVWYLSFARDLESYRLDVSGVLPTIEILAGSNGRSDAEDVLAVLGLLSANPIANVTAGVDSNEFVLGVLRDHLITDLERLFDGVPIDFTFASPGTFPPNTPAIAYSSLGFSQICIAGAASTAPSGTLGAALFDANNQAQNDDCIEDLQGQRLGIFLHTFAHVGIRAGATSSFRATFAPFIPQLTSGVPAAPGVPIGEASQDEERLRGNLNDARTTQIDNALAGLARAVAVVIAHECGHSMGLVANGAMPRGLYGNDSINFPGSGSGANLHIETPGLFPNGAQNVMSASISYDSAIHPSTGFNSLNLAYLRERALYDRQ